MIHWPLMFGHHAAKGVVAHAAHKTAKAAAGHAVATHAAAVGATAAKGAAVTRVAAHGAVAKHIAATAVSAAPKVPMVP